MRLALINTERGWRGGELQVELLARGLRRCGIEPLVIARAGEPQAERSRAAGLLVATVAGDGLGAVPALRRILARERIDLIHAHASRCHQLVRLAGLFGGPSLVVTRRVDFPLKRGPLARWKYGGVARWIAVSAGVARVLGQGGVEPGRITVIHDGIDLERSRSGVSGRFRSSLSLPPGLVVACIAALVDHKDHGTLLRAWAVVEQAMAEGRVPPANLVLAGRGEQEAALRAQAIALGLGRCVFAGWRSDIPDLLADADVAVLTSHLEGLGSSIMDAMACGLPVVATRAGGIPELIDDSIDGRLCPVRDHQAVASALITLLADAGQRQALGQAARQRADAHFSAEAMVAAHLPVYQQALGLPQALGQSHALGPAGPGFP